jgi:hypothetical protein
MIVTPIVIYVVQYLDIWKRPKVQRFNTRSKMEAFTEDLKKRRVLYSVCEVRTPLSLIIF